MSERKKETLFRFKTLRTPELIADEAKEKYFIKHPDGTSGPFYAAIAAMTGGDTKKGVLYVAATAFTGDKTKKQIKSIDPALSKFGLFLAKKKKKLTLAEINTEIAGLSALSATKELKLWDSLLYQTVKAESGYAREAILQLIIANYFVTKFSGMDLTDASMQKWAKSRVVISLELAAKENDYFDTSTENDSASGKDILLHHIETAEAKIKIDLVTKAEKELTSYKTAFLKTNNKQEKNAIDAHTIAVQTAQDSATKVDKVDQFTQFTFKTFTNYTAPVYNFQKPDEIEKSTMQSSFSAETSFLMEEKDLFLASTFDEMDSELENHSKTLTKSIFDRSQFFIEKVDVDGTYVSTCEMKHRFNKKHKFILKLIQKSTNGYGAILTIDVGDECLKLDMAIANFKAPVGTTFTTNDGTNLNGILTVDLLPNKSIDLSTATSLEVSGELIFSNGLVLNFAKDLVGIDSFMSGTMTVNSSSSNNSELFIPTSFGMKQLGIADYRKVEQTLCCYVPGEVAHIENVMAREYKERSTRRLRRSDEKNTSTSSLESESMTDTSTTSRFDMQKEISKIISESKERNISVGFDASVGGKKTVLGSEIDFRVGANFSADFATSSSSEESESESTSFAKDITEKATQRLVSNVSEERTTRIIEEFEENNQHGLDNRQGAEHISGVYRWVDKIYKNEIHNYGKRLQYEFMIPEPSKFHLIAKASGITSSSGISLIKPIDPRKDKFGILDPIRNSAHILPTNYHQWAAVYGATVSPPPNATLNIGTTLVRPDDGSSLYDSKVVKEDIVIPDGYGIQDIRFSVGGIKVEDWSHYFVGAAGITKKIHEGEIHSRLFTIADERPELRGFTRSVPVSAQFSAINGGVVSFSIKLSRKHSLMEKWQLSTFKWLSSNYHCI